MKITRIETITCTAYRLPQFQIDPQWVQIHTDDGLVGLGETWFNHRAAGDYIHGTAGEYLLGKDPRTIELHHRTLRTLRRSLTFGRMNDQVSAFSAIDFALWDLLGQSVGLPVYRLLGGPARDSIRVYNTCHGYEWYSPKTPYYEDQVMWQERDAAGELAVSLLDMGITAMKVWPFDPHRLGTDGEHITQAQIDQALRPFRRIREAVGMQMDLPVELHGGWYLQAAVRIAEALQEIRPMWIEDPLRNRTNIAAHAELAAKTPIPVAISEAYCGRAIFGEILDKRAAGIINMDVGWVGGLSEAHLIAQMAQVHDRPFACHAPTGPVNFMASAHLCMAEPNAMIQEGVRSCYLGGWYQQVVTELPKFEQGHISAPSSPGLGACLRPEFLARPDIEIRTSKL